jgi:hypothetical protein
MIDPDKLVARDPVDFADATSNTEIVAIRYESYQKQRNAFLMVIQNYLLGNYNGSPKKR